MREHNRYRTIQEYMLRELQMSIAVNWRRMRLEHGLTQEELSNKSGICLRTLGETEDGYQQKLSTKDCVKTAQVYGMSPEEFIAELTSGITMEGAVAYRDISCMDLTDVFPYNLARLIFGYDIPPSGLNIQGVNEAIDSLNDKERMIILLRYRKNMRIRDISDQTGMSKERVRTIEARALRKLRYPGWLRKMKAYSFDDITREIEKSKSVPEGVQEQDHSDTLDISCMNLSARARTVLSRCGCITAEDIERLGKTKIEKTRGCGLKTIEEIGIKMLEYGYEW